MTTERIIRSFAGTVVLASLALGVWVNPNWLWLTAFAGLNLFQRSLALTTLVDRMHFDIGGISYRFQALPWMTRLTPLLFPAPLAQTPRRGFLQPITRGRLPAIAAIFGQLIFQRLNPSGQPDDNFDQTVEQGQHRFFTLLVRCLYVFSTGDTWSCHTLILACLYDFSNFNVRLTYMPEQLLCFNKT